MRQYTITTTSTKRGFTLIELLVVISLITFLLSVILPTVSEVQRSSRDTARITAVKQVKNALDTYWPNNFRYPLPASGSCVDLAGWSELDGYMSGAIKDPLWPSDQNFTYCTPTDPSNPLYGRAYGILVRLESQDQIDAGLVNQNGYCKTGILIEELDEADGIWNEPIDVPICNF